MKVLAVAALALCLSAPSAPVYGHGGGLDRYGCHRETATGGYHCHRGSKRDAEPPSTPPGESDDDDWKVAAVVIGGLVVVGIAVWWWNKRQKQKEPSASLINPRPAEPRLRYGVQFDGEAPSLRVMWRF